MNSPDPKPTRYWKLITTIKLWRIYQFHSNCPGEAYLSEVGYYKAHNKIKIHVSEQQGLAEDLNHRALPPKVSEFIKAHAAILA